MADVAMESAPGDENDDNWLYGESTGDQSEEKSEEPKDKEPEKSSAVDASGNGDDKDQEDGEENNDDSQFNDEHFADVGRDDQDQNGDADSQENGDSDSDDSDDVKVTIGEIKSGPQYASLNIKRGVGLVATGADKPRSGTTAGKVTLEDLDGLGSINGVPALEFNIDTIEDKPWNKPGADISDYFNYGFNEVTWSSYCERQRRMRVNEAGVGMHVGSVQRIPQPDMRRPTGMVRNDEGMPPVMTNNYQARENTIQVMTAERREYGRSGHTRDLPPTNEYFGPPPTDYYPPPHAPYEEPWGHTEQSGWTPTEIKELTPGPMGPPAMVPPVNMPQPALPTHVSGPHMMPGAPYGSPYRPHHPHHERDRDRERDTRMRERDERERRDRRDDEERDRDRDRDRSRSIKPERIREKSYRRERSRSRSRSRRHKSRSRSPRLRERSRDRDRSRDRENDRSRERDRSRDRERSVKPKTKDKEKDDDK